MTLRSYPTGFLRVAEQDQAVRSGDWLVGRMWQDPNATGDLYWRWSLYVPITGPRSISRLGRRQNELRPFAALVKDFKK
jgi:hypothetical protein